MAPQFVKPYVKNVEQQSILSMHRVRQGFVKARTAQANQIRGLLSEFGVAIPWGIGHIARVAPVQLSETVLPDAFRHLIERLLSHFKELDRQVGEIERLIQQWHRASELSRKLEKVLGIGPLTASALVASIGDAKNFENGRQLAAWLGLVPKQHSSGGKSMLLGISKRGDSYLRTLMIHGARAVIAARERTLNTSEGWLKNLLLRRSKNVAAVALANKNARIVWALLSHERDFDPDHAMMAA